MSNIANLSNQIAKLSTELTAARARGDIELSEEIEDELNDLEDQLAEEEEITREGGHGWV